jgi:hypothetical protein
MNQLLTCTPLLRINDGLFSFLPVLLLVYGMRVSKKHGEIQRMRQSWKACILRQYHQKRMEPSRMFQRYSTIRMKRWPQKLDQSWIVPYNIQTNIWRNRTTLDNKDPVSVLKVKLLSKNAKMQWFRSHCSKYLKRQLASKQCSFL